MKLIYTLFLLLLCVLISACGRTGEADDVYDEPQPTSSPVEETHTAHTLDPSLLPIVRTPLIPERSELQDFSTDAVAMVDFVEAVHPSFVIEGRMCMEQYDIFRTAYLTETAGLMTHTEFTLATQHFLTVFNDGHLARTFHVIQDGILDLFQDGYFIEHYFISRYGRLFLADENLIKMDVEVLAIGGVPVADIFATIDRYFGAYNDAGRQRNHGRYARYQLMLQRAGAMLYTYEGRIVVDVTVQADAAESTIEMGFVSHHPTFYRHPSFSPPYFIRWETLDDAMYIDIQGQLWEYDGYNDAAEAIIQALADGIRNFIIDLRNVPGGDPAGAYALLYAMGVTPAVHGEIIRVPETSLRAVLEEYFPLPYMQRFANFTQADIIGRDYVYVPPIHYSANPYDVLVIALTSDRTFSAGTYVAALIADSCFGMVIGEPSATAPTGYGNGYGVTLDISMLVVRPPFTFIMRPDGEADPQTLWPDIQVYEWLALETALDFIANDI